MTRPDILIEAIEEDIDNGLFEVAKARLDHLYDVANHLGYEHGRLAAACSTLEALADEQEDAIPTNANPYPCP